MTPEDRLQQATFERVEAEEAWRAAILQAHKAGLTHRAIAPLADVSYQRVGQILNYLYQLDSSRDLPRPRSA